MHCQNTRLTQSTFQTVRNFFAPVLAFVFLGCASDVTAAVKTWDGTTSGNWGTSANWTPAGVPVDGDDLIFPAGAANLNNTNNITDLRVASIQFNGAAGGYILNGNAITISNGVVAAHTVGDNDLSFAAITNATSQTYTVDSGGTLDVNANLVLIGGFTLTVNNDFTTRFDGAISGTGNLSKSSAGTGTMVFGGTAANTYAGTTTVNGAILQLSKTAGVVSVPGDLTIGASDTVRLTTDNQIANGSDVTISSSGLLDLNGNVDTIGTVSMSGATIDTGVGGDIATGNITVNASASVSTISGTYTLAGNRTFTVAGGTANPALLVSAVIEGAGGVTVNNLSSGARVDFSAANTYSGLTTLSNGFLYVNNPAGLGSSAVGTVLAGGNLTILGVTISGEGLTNITTSVLQGAGASGWTGPIVLNATLFLLSTGTLDLSGVISGTGGVIKASSGSGTVRYSGASANTYTGTTTVDAGTLELAKSAGIDAIAGDLVIGDGSGTDTVRTFASNLIDNSSDLTMNEGAVLDLQAFIEAVGSATMTGATVDGTATTFNPQGSLTVNASAVSSTINKDLAVSVPTTINVANGSASTDLLINGVIFGAGGFTKTGEGQLRLAGVNTYSGLTVVAAGLLTINDAAGLGSTAAGTVVSNGASLAIGATVAIGTEPLTLNGLGSATHVTGALYSFNGPNSWAGPIMLASDSIIDVLNSTFDLSGVISGPGGFTKVGTGTLTLAGTSDNTYTGNTFVNEGILQLAKTGFFWAVANGTLTIGDGVGGINADVVRYTGTSTSEINAAVPIIINASGLLDLNGHSDDVGALALISGDITTGAGILTMGGNLTAVSTSTGSAASISGFLNLGNSVRTFTVTNGPTTPDLQVTAQVSGTGGITKAGDGHMSFLSSNSFSGVLTLNDGTVRLDNDFAAGTIAGGVVVNGDASLEVVNGTHVGDEPLTLNSTASGTAAGALDVPSAGSNSWAGDIIVSTTAHITGVSTATLNLLGAISGPGGIIKDDSCTLIFSGGTANTYTGTTTVNQGTLILDKGGLNGAIIGPLIIGDGAGGVNADVVRLAAVNQIENTVPVTVSSSGLYDTDSFADAIGSLSGTGNVDLGGATMNIGFDDSSATFSGIISGTGGINKFTGTTGTQTLSGNNTYTGTTVVNGGTLLVNGSQPQSSVSIGTAGILGGTGTVGNISASGVVAPGTSPGMLTSSNVAFAAAGTFPVELNGTTVGSGYDQLSIRGTNSLTGAALSVSVGYVPTEDDQFRIINNDGIEAVTGTFDGLPEGSVISVGNFRFRISYVGGTGNDVVLTVTNQFLKPGAAFVFSGNGNGAIEPDECNLLSLVVSNLSGVAMTGLNATLRSVTPGVVVIQPFSTYPNIPSGNRRTNDSLFQVTTVPGFVCGTTVDLELEVVTATHGTLIAPFSLPSGVIAAGVRFNNNAVTAIPDASFVDSTVAVAGITTPLKKVVVLLHITHTAAADLDVSLIGPDGTTVGLTSDNGGVASDYGVDCTDAGRTTFDSSAATAITAVAAPFVGTFRPEQPLTAFNEKSGTDVNGLWTLRVTDDTPGAVGSIRCWSLILSPTACSPGSGICELCPDVTINSAFGPGSPTQTNYVTLNSVASACGVPKTCPGTTTISPIPYNSFTFRNGPTNACVTVTLENLSPSGSMISAAYLGSFNPANPDKCVNYLADIGFTANSSAPIRAYSFNVASNATFVVTVLTDATTVAPYLLRVSGGDCRPVLDITQASSTQVQLDWTTAAAGYQLERTNDLVSGAAVWPTVTNIPIVINSRFTVTNSSATSNQFFRLRKPLP